jgi:hypothetical protein
MNCEAARYVNDAEIGEGRLGSRLRGE